MNTKIMPRKLSNTKTNMTILHQFLGTGMHWFPLNKNKSLNQQFLHIKHYAEMQSQYLIDNIHKYTSVRTLRSFNLNLCKILQMKISALGSQAFCYSAPYIRRDLTENVEGFSLFVMMQCRSFHSRRSCYRSILRVYRWK